MQGTVIVKAVAHHVMQQKPSVPDSRSQSGSRNNVERVAAFIRHI